MNYCRTAKTKKLALIISGIINFRKLTHIIPMSPINLSKSAFTKGLQCYKALYLKKHFPELEDQVSESQQAIFNTGHNVGHLAKQLFPGGVDLGSYIPDQINKVFEETKKLLQQKQIIYEAGFSFDNNLCFSDIVVPKGNKWKIYEVKASTSVKEVYLWDAAFQYFLITQSGFKVEDISIVHVNNEYERIGELDIQQLFNIQSVLELILPMQVEVKRQIAEIKKMLNKDQVPDIVIGPHCGDPYPCSFLGHCWKHIPDYSVFNISRLKSEKKFDLYNQGILEITEIPDEFGLSHAQRLQVEGEKNGTEIINKEAIRKFVSNLHYPLYFLDFETFNPPVPLFDYSNPYQMIAFQYSLHIQEKEKGGIIHKEFLAETNGDPRIPFIKQLIKDLGKKGDILVYNQAFESTRLKEIARNFPAFEQEINNILNRIVDLMVVFSRKDYYTPAMKGSYSIKKVLPALVSGFGYDGLDIADGGTASNAFVHLYNEADPDSVKKIRTDLLAYCKMDTLAMVEILRVLEKK